MKSTSHWLQKYRAINHSRTMKILPTIIGWFAIVLGMTAGHLWHWWPAFVAIGLWMTFEDWSFLKLKEWGQRRRDRKRQMKQR